MRSTAAASARVIPSVAGDPAGQERHIILQLADFKLTKWYLDCVDDSGAVCIGYWAELRWKQIAVSYSGVLQDGTTREHLFVIEPPRIHGDVLTWRPEPLQCEFELRKRAPSLEQTLFPGVAWHCLMPAADAMVCIRGRELRGHGYAEVVELTLPPWKLPIDELRWGRFSGEALSIVWIDWQGSHPLNVVLIDGCAASGAVRDGTVTAGDLSLSIGEDSVIRSAPLSETLAAIPLLTALVPKRLLHAREKKWCGRGTVRRGDDIADQGWVVHEKVTFV